MKFETTVGVKKLCFDSEVNGLIANGQEYEMSNDGGLIYDKVKDIKSDQVTTQMSSDTSTLIPSFMILDWVYNPYFDERNVVESQNDITFYWNKSKLAAFYNLYATDELKYKKREETIRDAINFLLSTSKDLRLNDEYLNKLSEPCILVGFFQGFPVFDSSKGLAKLQSRLGIHIDSESIMISTPLDKYEGDIYDLAEKISDLTGETFNRKKNRVVFCKSNKMLELITK
ncbi:MAG: hypothetical protein WCV93_04640 [Candidatus Shapirobacteria bacterium]|jgi:hypothetical protein